MLAVAILLTLRHGTDGRWTLKDGTAVSVVLAQPSKKLVWRPDGSPVNYDSIPKMGFPTQSELSPDISLVVYTNPRVRQYSMPSVRFKFPTTSELDAPASAVTTNKKIFLSLFFLPKSQPAQQDLAIGVASGAWRVKGWVAYVRKGNSAHEASQHGYKFDPDLTKDPLAATKGEPSGPKSPITNVTVMPFDSFKDMAVRIVAHDVKGKEMEAAGSYRPLPNGPTTYFFAGDQFDLRRIELQTRSFEWHTIWATHFRPKSGP